MISVLVLALLTVPGAALATGSPADRAGMDTVVRVFPPTVTPNVSGPIKTNYVAGMAEVGGKIVAGGNFTQVRNPGSTVQIPRNYIFAFDKATGVVDTAFVPAVNGVVDAVVAHPDGQSVFIVGNFSTVNGQASFGIAKLNINNGQRVAGFTTTTQGRVRDAVLHGNRLFLAGDIWRVGTVTRNRLAAVDINTGAVDPNFAPVVGAQRGGTSSWVSGIDVSPDGTRAMVIGNFLSIDGQPRVQIAMLDLTTNPASVANWSTQGYASACNTNAFWTYMRDVEFSPDNQYFVVATTGGPYPGTLCDSAARWETSAQGSNLLPTWSNLSGGDTLTAVAVTKAAVYIGGHQRWMNNHLGRDSALIGAVSRLGIAALDPINGVPLRWNPGRDPGANVYELLVTSNGMFLGHDTDFVNFSRREKLAFFPRLGGTAVPVPTPVDLPVSFYQTQPDGTITKADYNGTTVTPRTTVPNTGDWSAARGVTLEAGYVYYTQSDNKLYRKSFDGTTFGSAEDLVAGVYVGTSAPPMTSISALAWDNGRLYYTKTGTDTTLRYRYLSLESGIMGGEEFTVSGGINWVGTTGIEFVGSHLYYTKADLNLWRVSVANGTPVAGTQAAISGPAIDGQSWSGSDSFVRPAAVGPDLPPTVSVTAPAGGATVSGTVAITANASDDKGVNSVNFRVDGVSVGTDSNGADGWSVQWNTANHANGAHALSAIATDTINQTTTSSSVNVTVSNAGVPVLMVVAAPATLDAGEVAVSNRLTGSGYSVAIIDDDAVTAADANGRSFVLLSSSVSSSLAATFKNIGVPLLVAQPSLFGALGMTGGTAGVDFGSKMVKTIQMTNPGHPLAAGQTGSIALRNGKYSVSFGLATASATVVATADGSPTIFTIAAGAQLADATAAAGCRLTFPIFEGVPQNYNGTAWTMFDAAATYAANGCS